MSGEKRTRVSVQNEELRRIREEESRLRLIETDLSQRVQNINNQLRNEMTSRMDAILSRQSQYDSVVNSLQSEIAKIEQETQRRLQQQNLEFNQQLQSQRGEYLRIFQEQDAKFTRLIEEERQIRQAAVNNLQSQINSITSDAMRKQNVAMTFVADLQKILAEVSKLPHQRFAPGELDKIRRSIDDAVISVNNKMPEAALSTGQSAYWELSDLRVKVLQKEREFMLLYEAAIKEAMEILEQAKANRTYKLEIGKGVDQETYDLEVDYWTRGELSAYQKEIEDILSHLKKEESTLSIEEVRAILSRLESLESRLPEIVDTAKQNIIASQLRTNIADLVVEALQNQGFSLQDAVYEGNDQRNSYVAKLTNIAGTEVVTVISPVEGELGKNTVSIHSYDETFVDERTLKQRAREIVEVIKEGGLEVDEPVCAGSADKELKDINEVRRRVKGQVKAKEGKTK